MTRIAGLDDRIAKRVLERLHELEQEAVAVVVRGSYARGRAELTSDLDVSAIVQERSAPADYWTWFEPRPGALPLHVSAGIHPSTSGSRTGSGRRVG